MNLPGLVKFDDVSPDDIAKVIKNSPTKSCLLDPWPTFLVKDCLDILLPSITKLVICSLLEGAVPDGFKSAVVTPLIKKSSLSKDELKNYRPVSGLSFISKLVECVVASQLSRHVSLHGLKNEYQSAYRRSHSTETALLSIKNQIHLSLARGEAIAVVLLDQSAAFDTIDHDKLLDCLRNGSVSGVDALTGSNHTFLIIPNASRLVLFCLRLESLSLVCHKVQFLVLLFFRCIPHL